MKRIWNNAWIKAVVINIVVLVAVMSLTDLAYETNDDYVISLRIADGYPFSSFVNYFLCRILIAVQGVIPGINAFVCMQIAVSVVCFICITRVFLDSFNNRYVLVIAVFVITVFAIDHYSIIQFTKTSALMLTSGMLVVVHAIISKKSAGWYGIAFVLIYLGTWLRNMNLIVAVGSAGIFLIFWIFINRRELLEQGYLSAGRIAIYAVCVLLLAGSMGTYILSSQINKSTKELAYFSEYDKYRSLVTDYPVYEDYKSNSTPYEMEGLSENDIYLVSNWYLDYDGAASLDNLKTMYSIYKSNGGGERSIIASAKSFLNKSISDVKDFNRRGMHLVIIGCLFIAGLLLYKPKYWTYLVCACAFGVLLYVYLYYLGRPLYRATYIADIGTIVWMLYYTDDRYLRKPETVSSTGIFAKAVTAICIVSLLICQIPLLKASEQLHSYATKGRTSEEMTEFINSNPDSLFVFGKGVRGLSEYYSKPIFVPERGYQRNAIGFGSWGTKSPYILQKLDAYGLDNTFGDLINNEKAFVFEDNNVARLTEYMNKWYGTEKMEIFLEQVDIIDGHPRWKVRSR